MNKILLATTLVMLMVSHVSAGEGLLLEINNETLTIKGYIETEFAGRVSANIIEEINQSIGSNLIVCDNIEITEGNETKTYNQNCTLNIDFTKDIPFLFNDTKNTIIGDSELQRKFEQCLEDKSQFNAGLKSCNDAKIEQGEYKQNYTECFSDLKICNSEKSIETEKRAELQKESDENKNRHWVWGAIGVGATVLFFSWRDGKIFGPRTKKEEETYNAQQSA